MSDANALARPPPGKKWVRQFWLFGPWVLVDDPEFPLPPDGYRYRLNPLTAKKELYSVVGKGVDWFSDGNEIKIPRSRPMWYVTPSPIDPTKIGKGIQFVGPESADANPDPKLRRQGQSRYDTPTNSGAAIF